MLTIPTGDLTGVLADAVLFAFPEDDLEHVNCVRVAWDGEMLHVEATDTLHAARSSWHPDDCGNGDQQGTLHNPYGGDDEPWALIVALPDAKEVVKDYKLPAKESGVPLTLVYDDGALTIRRSRDSGHLAKKIVLEGRMVEFPPVGKLLDEPVDPMPIPEITYSGVAWARIGQVRQRGALTRMVFGATRTSVTIGERFVAVLAPDRSGDRPVQTEAAV
jgi:hypothetical protein